MLNSTTLVVKRKKKGEFFAAVRNKGKFLEL
jgi:hypothetical protein